MLLSTSLLLLAACPRGFEPVDDACVAAPKEPRGVVVYFHGMLGPTTDWAKVPELSVLGAEAKKRGQLLVALRGEAGLCLWAKDVRDWWCWPNDRSQLLAVGRTLERVGRVLAKVASKGLGPPVYAGFSNGGFFTTLLMSDTKVDAKAYAVLHAGSVTGQDFSRARPRPTLLVGASKDAIQLPTMRKLQGMLDDAGWQPQWVLRDGVHEITAADAKALFDFIEGLAP